MIQNTMIRWGRALVFSGFGIVVLGALLFRLEVKLALTHNLKSASGMSGFRLSEWAHLTAYMVGALLAVVGAVVTCFGSDSKQLVQAGAFFLFGTFIMITAARQIFFQTGELVWTRGMVFTAIVAFIVGLIFLSVGLTRRLVRTRR